MTNLCCKEEEEEEEDDDDDDEVEEDECHIEQHVAKATRQIGTKEKPDIQERTKY